MGRMFEKRKHTMFARFDRMAKQFARIGKDITIAVRAGGPDPDGNPMLRRVIQNGRAVNMPKDKIDAAIKRAVGRDATDYEEIRYEGYAPHGIALVIETATDNPVRTVANLRPHYNRGGGALGTDGSVTYLFQHIGVFTLAADTAGDADGLELDLIDAGLDEMGESETDKGDPTLVLRCAFAEFGSLQRALEERGIEPLSSEAEWVPLAETDLDEEAATDVLKLLDRLEQDDDVQKVFHTLA